MKLLFDAFKEKLMDVRLRDKLLYEGKISQEQIDEYLKSLPDEKNHEKDGAKLSGSSTE